MKYDYDDYDYCNETYSQRCRHSKQGPTGPKGDTGPVGTILGSYSTLRELMRNHPCGSQGDAYLVKGELYVWNEKTRSWKNVGNLSGPAGPTGPAGSGLTILGSYNTLRELIAAHPTGEPGDAYLVAGELYVWNEGTHRWQNLGRMQGPTGPTGAFIYAQLLV